MNVFVIEIKKISKDEREGERKFMSYNTRGCAVQSLLKIFWK